jgi:hypothetical protein
LTETTLHKVLEDGYKQPKLVLGLNVSELTNALNRIRACLESNYPVVAAQLPPGLSVLRIEETFQPLPYKLPQEAG